MSIAFWRYTTALAVATMLLIGRLEAQTTQDATSSIWRVDNEVGETEVGEIIDSGEPLVDEGLDEVEEAFAAEGSPHQSYDEDVFFSYDDSEVVHGSESVRTLFSHDYRDRGIWYIQQDITFMHRSKPRASALSGRVEVFGVNTVFTEFLTTQTSVLRTAPGARITLGHHLGRDDLKRDHNIEFTFLGLFEWDGSAQLNSRPASNGDQVTPTQDTNYPGFANALFHRQQYQANMNSYELNYRIRQRPKRDQLIMSPEGTFTREVAPTMVPTYLLGIRYIQTNEQFAFLSRGVDPGTLSGDYLVSTQNDMFGIQVGVDMTHQRNWWNVGFKSRVGGFVNYAESIADVTVIDNSFVTLPGDRHERATDQALMFLGELGLFANWQLRSNMVVRVSWDVLYMQGMALAPEQITFNPSDPPRINVTGFTITQGLSLGFEINW